MNIDSALSIAVKEMYTSKSYFYRMRYHIKPSILICLEPPYSNFLSRGQETYFCNAKWDSTHYSYVFNVKKAIEIV